MKCMEFNVFAVSTEKLNCGTALLSKSGISQTCFFTRTAKLSFQAIFRTKLSHKRFWKDNFFIETVQYNIITRNDALECRF